MSEMSIVTNDEIMEMTQLVFDRYYTELKRQLRRGEIPEERVEQYCTEILAKVYQAIQLQGVNATSYELDACAIPIINEEIKKILVPLHLNGYRNLRENPKKEEPEASGEENVSEKENVSAELQNLEVTEIKAEDAVQVISNGEVQVYTENSEMEMNPELRMEIRRILQQEFQMEPAQIKPVVVVVNVTAPQPKEVASEPEVTPEETVVPEPEVKQTEEIMEAEPEALQAEELAEAVEEVVVEAEAEAVEAANTKVEAAEEVITEPEVEPETAPAEEVVDEELVVTEVKELVQRPMETEPLPELDFDLDKMVQETKKTKRKSHLWLWFPILLLLFILIWLTIGMLMSYDVIPDFDLGYGWFNETLFDLFEI